MNDSLRLIDPKRNRTFKGYLVPAVRGRKKKRATAYSKSLKEV